MNERLPKPPVFGTLQIGENWQYRLDFKYLQYTQLEKIIVNLYCIG